MDVDAVGRQERISDWEILAFLPCCDPREKEMRGEGSRKDKG